MFAPYDKLLLEDEQIVLCISTTKSLGEIEVVLGIS